jgi:stage II sporulation protein AA (anti-sigma F factor antagonist)
MAGAGAIEMKFLGHTASQQCHAIVDMSGVSFIASMGMGLLVDAAKSLQRHDAKLVLVAVQPMVETAMRNARLEQIIDIVATADEAKQLIEAA